ncbi:DUF305 domain-containing protein [Nocardia otitidiscaviarum]|uniref:DUF305 domain-containing protein n=1 Tax=Nocardia otitidiscaviarum TaxID=1823 RepID=A0A516NFP5_9NOCA|nr:DUF305 domain-containing protein [Nocardia otitidiscaviarum]MCP9623066.1 DUF305 domain-containing protein [Nocardia otitidiscaviarum]QDP77733.1 DUF305 domain-containing protein [Nocardia otitidiscaviarum]
MFESTRVKLAVLTGLSSAALVAAGCGGNDAATVQAVGDDATTSVAAATRSDFNAADVEFLQMMYPHHAQAVEMAKLVPGRTQNQELIALAQAVEQAQAPEMRQISTLLVSFGKPAPGAGGGHAGHGGMPGMMSPEQMTALELASGAAFDEKWMTMMIEHHQGAIAMAETELAQGVNAEAKQLAEAIITAQRIEIDQMRKMLGQ